MADRDGVIAARRSALNLGAQPLRAARRADELAIQDDCGTADGSAEHGRREQHGRQRLVRADETAHTTATPPAASAKANKVRMMSFFMVSSCRVRKTLALVQGIAAALRHKHLNAEHSRQDVT